MKKRNLLKKELREKHLEIKTILLASAWDKCPIFSSRDKAKIFGTWEDGLDWQFNLHTINFFSYGSSDSINPNPYKMKRQLLVE